MGYSDWEFRKMDEEFMRKEDARAERKRHMDGYRYRLLQRNKDGSLWRQPDEDCATGDFREVQQCVMAGYLHGEPRWAETAKDGMFLFGLDCTGRPHKTGTGSEDFSD